MWIFADEDRFPTAGTGIAGMRRAAAIAGSSGRIAAAPCAEPVSDTPVYSIAMPADPPGRTMTTLTRTRTSRAGPAALAPLDTLIATKRGKVLPLPPRLARLYGRLRMPLLRSRPHVFSNFVTTLDGVVSLNVKGHASGGDISGFNAQDRMVMGLLRAVADVVIVGSGTLRADRPARLDGRSHFSRI